MPTTTYIPTKVLLHDPDTVTNPKSLYPVTGLNAIVAGVDSSSNAIYIATSDTNKIKYQYLEIVGSNGVITSGYLPMSFTDGGKIANSSLDIFTTEGGNLVIKSDLLPSFVDDVVSVPVITNISQATGDLVILQTTSGGTTTYNFYKKGANNTYVAGGGEEGKIYISDVNGGQGDGSIYRCVSGSTTVAVKISENPYAVASTKTNGVYLDTTNGTLTAKADKAATDAFGTVKISTEATNNVKLTVSDGVIAASAGLANAAAAGMVVAVGTNAEASAMTSAFGDTYIVPNVAYMSSFVSSFVPTVDKASYEDFGVVKITNNGNIDCTSGVLTVASAAASVNGVVKIVDTINTAAEGNSSKAVTQAGIVGYVTGQLANYQPTLSEGSGIDIDNSTVSVLTSGAVVISSGYVTARDANSTSAGVVLITGDSSFIANASATLDGHPIAVNPAAVKDYIDSLPTYSIPVAGNTTRGGFRTSGSATGLTMGTPSIDTVEDVLKVNVGGPVYIDTNNALNVSSASTTAGGIVQLVGTSAGIEDADNAGKAPTAPAVSAYVAGKIAGAVNTSAGYAATSDATTPALGGVRVVASGGIEVNSGNIYLHTADSNYLGGVKAAATNTAIGINGGIVSVNKALPLYIDTNNNLNISAATTASAGVVTVKNTAANVSAATGTSEVPNCTGVRDYVSTYVGSNATGKFTAGSGLAWNTGSTTLDAQTEAPIQITSDKITRQTAVGPTGSAALPSTALGAVYVRGTLRDIDTIDADETPAASVVPTESAVRTAMNALPYITYTVL